MALISVYRDTHWLTDLIVGALIGAVVLRWTTLADQLQDTPDTDCHALEQRSGRPGLQTQGQ
jgi:membrane-associated phospholipid phosphatase